MFTLGFVKVTFESELFIPDKPYPVIDVSSGTFTFLAEASKHRFTVRGGGYMWALKEGDLWESLIRQPAAEDHENRMQANLAEVKAGLTSVAWDRDKNEVAEYAKDVMEEEKLDKFLAEIRSDDRANTLLAACNAQEQSTKPTGWRW